MRSLGTIRLSLIVLTIAAVGSVAVGRAYRSLLGSSGLAASTWAGTGFQGSPFLQTRDAAFVAIGQCVTAWEAQRAAQEDEA